MKLNGKYTHRDIVLHRNKGFRITPIAADFPFAAGTTLPRTFVDWFLSGFERNQLRPLAMLKDVE